MYFEAHLQLIRVHFNAMDTEHTIVIDGETSDMPGLSTPTSNLIDPPEDIHNVDKNADGIIFL